MAKLFNLARMTTATTGTGTIALGAAVSGYLTFALAGISDGDTVSYGINDGANSEVGTGVYTASGTTLTRSVTKSTNSDAAINLSGTAQVFITPRKEDLLAFDAASGLTSSQKNQARNNLSVRSGVGYSNLTVSRPNNTTINITADHVDLYDASGNTYGVHGISGLVINTANVGVPNGIDASTFQPNTGYNYFVIYNPTTDTVAGLMSNVGNGNNPTLPAGYTYKRRIGWCISEGTPAIRTFIQRNASFSINNSSRAISVGASGLVFFSLTGFVPPTAAKIRGYLNTNNNNAQINDDSNTVILGINAAPANSCIWPFEFVVMTGTPGWYYSCSSGGGSAALTGWEDTL